MEIVKMKPFNDIKEWEDLSEWNKFVLIPVLVTTDASSSNSYYGSSNVISIQHDLKPGYARLKGGKKGTIQDAKGNSKYNMCSSLKLFLQTLEQNQNKK